ncbi:MAG: 50S ribosomal protein L19 [Epsilonproteobacteria bacterium]|nr:50S ribosomal protein L19 [Campylobacterota bacterium]
MKAKKLTKETILDHGVYDRNFPEFKVGDTIQVDQIVKEGGKERIQLFTGNVISMHKKGISSTFTVRKLGANNIGVEKIFPYYSKNIKDITLVKQGVVRRAKLYYLRDRLGKAAKVEEKIIFKDKAASSEQNQKNPTTQAAAE